MRLPLHWFTEPVTVETYEGNGAYGDEYAVPVTVLGHVSGGRRVAGGSTTDEVVSEQSVMLPNPCHLADGSGTVNPSLTLTPESRVTAGAVSGTVTKVTEHRKPGVPAAVYVSGVLG